MPPWKQLETDNLHELIARLHAAGFPATMIRKLVEARVDARYNGRRQELFSALATTPYWRPDPVGYMSNPKFAEQMSQIYSDRTKELRDVLGDEYFSNPAGSSASIAQRRKYGDLTLGKIAMLERLDDDYSAMTSEVRTATQGIYLQEDRDKLAYLQQEKLKDIAGILTPKELEEYQMRTSPITGRLGTTMSIMNASESEFQTIFKIEQSYADILFPSYPGSVAAFTKRDATVKEVYSQLKTALGEQRYNEFVRANDGEYQQLYRIAQRENVTSDSAIQAYNVRISALEESRRIASDTSLTGEQKQAALQTLAQNSRARLLATLGPTAGPAYLNVANRWLSAFEHGTAVSIGVDGMFTQWLSVTGTSR